MIGNGGLYNIDGVRIDARNESSCASSARWSRQHIRQEDQAHLPQACDPSMSDASLVADSDDEHAVSIVMDGPAGKVQHLDTGSASR